jgi:hypothetical protein
MVDVHAVRRAEEPRMHPSAFIIALATAGAALAGCSSSDNTPSGSSSSSTSNGSAAVPTFTEVYTQIISVNCLGCHVPGQIGVTHGMLDMSSQSTAYTDLVGVMAAGSACSGMGTRVVAGDPTTSLLYEKVSGTQPCGSRMPLDGNPLSTSDIAEIHDWIAGGALDD